MVTEEKFGDTDRLPRRPTQSIMAVMRFDRAIAPVLALWLSGVCCLLLCLSVCGQPAAVFGPTNRWPL
jgi:hypothetical protein